MARDDSTLNIAEFASSITSDFPVCMDKPMHRSYNGLEAKIIVIPSQLDAHDHHRLSQIYRSDVSQPFTIAMAFSIITTKHDNGEKIPAVLDIALITVEPDGRLTAANVVNPYKYTVPESGIAVYQTENPNMVAVTINGSRSNIEYRCTGEPRLFEPYLDLPTEANHIAELVDLIDSVKLKVTDDEYIRLMSCISKIHSKCPQPKRQAGIQGDPVYYQSLRVKVKVTPDKIMEYDIEDFSDRCEEIMEDLCPSSSPSPSPSPSPSSSPSPSPSSSPNIESLKPD